MAQPMAFGNPARIKLASCGRFHLAPACLDGLAVFSRSFSGEEDGFALPFGIDSCLTGRSFIVAAKKDARITPAQGESPGEVYRNALSALRITATSMASCSSAPSTTVM